MHSAAEGTEHDFSAARRAGAAGEREQQAREVAVVEIADDGEVFVVQHWLLHYFVAKNGNSLAKILGF